MAGATRRTLILAFTVLAVCACERRRFCVAGAALRGSFGSLADLSSEALKVSSKQRKADVQPFPHSLMFAAGCTDG
jgi:hypothetical protein